MKSTILAVLLAALVAQPAAAGAVGFQKLNVPDGANPPLEVGIWYPANAPTQPVDIELFTQQLAPGAPVAGHNLPLVVISHGNGGSYGGHSDTALALAEAGFVVAAMTHTGDSWRDQSNALDLAGRVRQFSAVVTYMLHDWPAHAVDPARVGAFGFSAGGFTVLAAAGGNPNLGLTVQHCIDHPEFYDCKLIQAHGGMEAAAMRTPAVFVADGRIRALVVAAPAIGFTFDAAGLREVTQPVQLWRAAEDHILPHPYYAEAVRAALPYPPEMHVVPGADHFDFLAPCSEALAAAAAEICVSLPGFDRAAFHARFNAAIVTFFGRAMPALPQP